MAPKSHRMKSVEFANKTDVLRILLLLYILCCRRCHLSILSFEKQRISQMSNIIIIIVYERSLFASFMTILFIIL